MPTTLADGRVLSTAPLEYEIAYTTQSRMWVAKSVAMLASPDSFTFYWPTVVQEAAPLVVWIGGTARPGERVAWAAIPVTAYDHPFSWTIRTRQRPNGNWSLWSNFCTRADNQ